MNCASFYWQWTQLIPHSFQLIWMVFGYFPLFFDFKLEFVLNSLNEFTKECGIDPPSIKSIHSGTLFPFSDWVRRHLCDNYEDLRERGEKSYWNSLTLKKEENPVISVHILWRRLLKSVWRVLSHHSKWKWIILIETRYWESFCLLISSLQFHLGSFSCEVLLSTPVTDFQDFCSHFHIFLLGSHFHPLRT